MLATSDPHPQPTIFGEVLFDCFPDGRKILGGAPFNVAWHLQGFGCTPHFISCIGCDELGNQVIAAMQHWGMETSGIQQDPAHLTGRVDIAMTGNSHQFDILPDQAYDHIRSETIEANTASPLLYHGSLILRSKDSVRALEQLKKSGTPVFLDINLREPWIPPDISPLLQEATWLKLNEEEFLHITTETGDINPQSLDALRRRHNLQAVIVTCGESGAWWCDAENTTFYQAPRVDAFVDSVGAGDAFSAIAIFGLLNNWPAEVIMRRARQFAARICGIRGATTNDHMLYTSTVTAWDTDHD